MPDATASRYRIEQMDCSAEEQLVRMALDQVRGIGQLRFDLPKREVVIAHTTDRVALDQALARLDLGAVHLDDSVDEVHGTWDAERPALLFALAVNATFFVAEVTFGFISGSMGVVADGLDMGADAGVYAVSLAAVGAAAGRKRQLARASGLAQLALATVGLAEVMRRFVVATEVPDTATMAIVSALALAGNLAVLLVLQRVRSGEVHLEASWIFTANDVKANLLVLAAAGIATVTQSAIPDLVAGLLIFAVVANGARRIWRVGADPNR